MALNIVDGSITSDPTGHTARRAANDERDREVPWQPGRSMNRNSAITAMLLAGPGDMHTGHKPWIHVEGRAAEPGLTAQDVLAQTSSSPGRTATGERALPAGPEAGE